MRSDVEFQWRDFDAATFLADYWQRKPLLIRNAFQEWTNPLEPDELAGLACEEGVEARLVLHEPTTDDWSLEHGPLPEARFSTLPPSNWTLLVQAVDHWVPEVAALLEPFRFLPNWRIDDVMVSYAADGGGVGPHVDQYDVFLIQGLGQRRWRVGPVTSPQAPLREGLPLRQLVHFDPVDEWILEPGDLLYLPPGFAHDGIAVGDDCMTYSVGFRAPARSELIAHWAGQAIAELAEDDRFRDPPLRPAKAPGEIDREALELARRMVLETLSDPERFAAWFGTHVTTPKYPELLQEPEPLAPAAAAGMAAAHGVAWMPGSRFAWREATDGGILLFADGEAIPCDAEIAELARRIADQPALEPAQISLWLDLPAAQALLCQLHLQGSLSIGDDDD